MSNLLKKLSKLLSDDKGFTLVELLVVIAILGILAGVTSPNITRYVTDAREGADIANAAIIANSMLRAVAEGYEIAETTTQVSIAGNILRDQRGVTHGLVPDFLQSLPRVQNGRDNFTYTYKDGVLRIYSGTGQHAKQLYPNPERY